MRFLLRVAFWLSVVVVLLPTSPPEKAPSTHQVSSTEAVSAASAAMSDMRQFCARQPDACTIGSHALTQFGYKAQAGAKMLYEFLNEKLGAEQAVTGSADKPAAASRPSQNTLTPDDLAPAWRGPPQRRNADAKRPA